jgi:hypothetical protein
MVPSPGRAKGIVRIRDKIRALLVNPIPIVADATDTIRGAVVDGLNW